MRAGLMAENPLERAVLARGLVPAGMLESWGFGLQVAERVGP